MPGLNENPFAVLTAVVAPAILTNACSVLSLGTANRICTLESTGHPGNPCAERLAAVAVDYQYSQLVIEHYFRQHGMDLNAMYVDPDFVEKREARRAGRKR